MKKIVFLTTFNWKSGLLHREHMLAKAFYKAGYSTSFIEKKYLGLNLEFYGKNTKNFEGVGVITFQFIPYVKGLFRTLYTINDQLLAKQLKSFLKKENGEITFICSSPYWAKAVNMAKRAQDKVVYDMSDDVVAFAKNSLWSKRLVEYEKVFLGTADFILVSNKNLLEKVEGKSKALLVENGVDLESFKEATRVLKVGSNKKIVGFIGGIYDWVDLDLVKKAVEEYGEAQFVLVGPTNRLAEISDITKLPNCKYVGEVEWQKIGDYFASLDVAMIPFVSESEYPRFATVNSNKVFQYAYFGYPIVSTAFHQANELRDLIMVSDSKEEFIKNIGSALKGIDKDKAKALKDFAKNNSWSGRVKQIEGFLNN